MVGVIEELEQSFDRSGGPLVITIKQGDDVLLSGDYALTESDGSYRGAMVKILCHAIGKLAGRSKLVGTDSDQDSDIGLGLSENELSYLLYSLVGTVVELSHRPMYESESEDRKE